MNENSHKGFAMPVIIAIVAIILVLGGVVYYYNASNEVGIMAEEEAMMEQESMEQKEEDVLMKETDDEIMKEDSSMNDDSTLMKEDEGAMMDKSETMMEYSGAMLAGESAPLLDFVKADYDAALETDKLIVLYFYANWCPICQTEFSVVQKAFDELTTDEVIGFRVNYNDDQTDSDEKDIAKQFGVAYQHTKVFVKNGQRILKSPEGWDEKRYDLEISKALE